MTKTTRQTTLHEFFDLGIPKTIEILRKEWELGYKKILKGEKVYDEEGNEL
tara:strand:+ start:578 stop:730 length:153 start_codon:yes stop_codon:yes gene_type:complete